MVLNHRRGGVSGILNGRPVVLVVSWVPDVVNFVFHVGTVATLDSRQLNSMTITGA